MNVRRWMNQLCSYWGSPQNDGYGGVTTAAPLLLPCRWEVRMERFVDTNGEEKMSRAVVYLDQDVEVGGWLALGDYTASLTSTTTTSIPTYTPSTDAWVIQAFNKSPAVRGGRYVRKAWL